MTQATLASRYDEAASWWQDMIERLGYRSAYENLISRTCLDLRPNSVADVGTGSGDLAAAYCAIKGAPEQLVLIDASEKMLEQARQTVEPLAKTVTTIHSNIDCLDHERVYDLVLCAHVIEHIENPGATLQQIGALLDPKGKLLLLVSRPHWCQWFVWIKWQHRWFSSDQVGKMAEKAGLEIEAVLRLNSGPPSRTSFAYLIKRSGDE